MDTTVDSAIEACRNRLRLLSRETFNVLAAELTTASADTVGTLTLKYANEGVAKGHYLGIGTEVLYVLSVDGLTVTVIRGARGTTPATHAVDSLIDVKGKFFRGLILQALLEEIRSWPPRLFATAATTISATQGRVGYDTGLAFPTEIIDVLRIWEPGATATEYRQRRVPFTVQRKGSTAVSAGNDLTVNLLWIPPEARTLHMEYSKPFVTSTFTAATDLVADVGLAPSMFDLAWLGATKRMFTEIPRTDLTQEGEPRRAEDVPGGLITSVRRDVEREYDERRNEEYQTLLHAYPPA